MTPQEMIEVVRATAAAPGPLWQRLNELRKRFDRDDLTRSRAVWEAFAAGVIDLSCEREWWDLLVEDVGAQPFARVRGALDALPALVAKEGTAQNTVRGLARGCWSADAFAAALVRERSSELVAALPSICDEAQVLCGAHLLLGARWPDAPLPAALVASAAEGFVSVLHDEPLHAKVRALVGEAPWWRAVAAAMARPDVRVVGVSRLEPALAHCDVPMLLAALEGVVRSQDDHFRAGAAVLIEAAFARDAAEATRRLDALVVEATDAAEAERRGGLPWDDARVQRARRLPAALLVGLAGRARRLDAAPPPTWDALLREDLRLHDPHDLELTRAAFMAFSLDRRAAALTPSLYTVRGLAVAPMAMTPANVDAMIAIVRGWAPKSVGPADKVIEALAQGGDHAREALRASVADALPHRAVLLRALSRFPHAAVAEELARLAASVSKAERSAIRDALVGQGTVGLAAVEGLLTSKKAELRELAVSTLEGLAARPEAADAVRTLAKRRVDSERSAALRATLMQLASAPSEAAVSDSFEDALAALASEVPEGERAALRQAVRDTEGRAASERRELGPALLPYLLEWVRATGGDAKRYESYWSFLEALDRHMDHPLAPRIAVAGLYALGEKKVHAAKGFVTTLRMHNKRPGSWSSLPWSEVQSRHAALAAEIRRALIAEMSAALPAQREHALAWLAEEAPVEAAAVFARALGDSANGIREQAVSVLTEKVTPGDALAALVAERLGERAKTTRLAAARVLAAWRCASVADHVRRALDAERQPEVAAELQRALPAAEGGDAASASSSREGPDEDDAALDARLAGLKAPRAPKWLDLSTLPPLRWRGGAALSPAATRWFIAWLGQESGARHDEALRQVRARIVDDDCHALCDAIRAQWRAGGSAKSAVEFVLCQQAVLGSEARLWELGSVQQQWYDAKNYKANQLAVQVLVRHGGYSALAWLERWSARARGGQFTKAVAGAVEALRAERGATLEALVDGLVPTQGDAAAIVEWQRARWELAMIEGRAFTPTAWRAHFVEHPLLAPEARALVFRARPSGALFRVDAQGVALDVDGRAVALEGADSVEIPHAASLGDDEVSAWRAVQTGALALAGDPLGPVGQLSREVFRAAPGVRDPFAARLGEGAEVGARVLAQRLRAGHFEPGDLIDGGSYTMGVRRVSRRWRVEVHHGGIAAQTSVMAAGEKVEVTGVSLRDGEAWVEPAQAPAGIVSEAYGWLAALIR